MQSETEKRGSARRYWSVLEKRARARSSARKSTPWNATENKIPKVHHVSLLLLRVTLSDDPLMLF